MYKSIKLGKLRIAIERFRKTAKNVSPVYNTGFHYWEALDSKNYSLVLGCNRIIFDFEKEVCVCSGKKE